MHSLGAALPSGRSDANVLFGAAAERQDQVGARQMSAGPGTADGYFLQLLAANISTANRPGHDLHGARCANMTKQQ